ncbi:MAG: CinA family nicotinamide mononucleotide deamidase-related protein [Candidatus Krumholzibacteria bacterium]|nr:CinA family nicotinamide mononucleotide deamidase-related protein [Candidatus Krumholzibacteria bacterium]
MTKTNEVEVILVGSELLKGERSDRHLAFIGRLLLAVGVRLNEAHVVADDKSRLARLIRDRARAARVVVITGGLGPTHDDITRESVAEAFGVPLEFYEDEWEKIERIFQRLGGRADDSNRRQAYFPRGAEPIANARGTAAGFVMDREGCLVAALPGPPRELIPMVEDAVLERIGGVFGRRGIYCETFRTTGIGESNMTPMVKSIFDKYDEFVFSSLPHIGGVDIVITQQREDVDRSFIEARANEFEQELRAVLGFRVYGKGDADLAAVLGRELVNQEATLAIAESLTGGWIGKRITDVAGSSRYLLADVVAYDNPAKLTLLDVKTEFLEKHGAVSAAVCREMAEGIRQRTGATYGLATTGIAGPGGGSKEKPVGLSYYGLTWDGGGDIRDHVFPGNREDVRERVTYAALFLLFRRLRSRLEVDPA